MNIIVTLLVILVVGIIVNAIDMNPTLKQIAYLIIGIAVVVTLLSLVGINVPNLR
jgi:hypothetical protein